jgi:hypothetical protein
MKIYNLKVTDAEGREVPEYLESKKENLYPLKLDVRVYNLKVKI